MRNTTKLGRQRPAQLLARVGLAAVMGLSLLQPVHATAADDKAADLLAEFSPPDGVLDPVLAALAEGRLATRVQPPRPGEVAPPPVVNGYAIRGADLAAFDATATAEGQAELAAYVDRLSNRGADIPADLRVYVLPDVAAGDAPDPGDLPVDTSAVDALSDPDEDGPLASTIILPGCAPLPDLLGAVILPDGSVYVKTTAATSPAGPGTLPGSTPCDFQVPGGDLVNEGPGGYDPDEWTPAGSLCWARKQNKSAWFDPCYEWFHRTDDGDANTQTYALAQWGTGKSKGIFKLRTLEVESWPKDGSVAQAWKDWSPRSDQDAGDCRGTTVGVNVMAAYIERSATICSRWDISKENPRVHFANRWRGEVRRKERETASFIASAVPNGTVPQDVVDYDYHATPEW